MSAQLTWRALNEAGNARTAANRSAFLPQTLAFSAQMLLRSSNLPQERYNSQEPVSKKEIPDQWPSPDRGAGELEICQGSSCPQRPHARRASLPVSARPRPDPDSEESVLSLSTQNPYLPLYRIVGFDVARSLPSLKSPVLFIAPDLKRYRRMKTLKCSTLHSLAQGW